MADEQDQRHDLNVPDGGEPQTREVAGPEDADGDDGRRREIKDQRRSDALAEKLATGDELSGYEKVAGRGLPPTE